MAEFDRGWILASLDANRLLQDLALSWLLDLYYATGSVVHRAEIDRQMCAMVSRPAPVDLYICWGASNSSSRSDGTPF